MFVETTCLDEADCGWNADSSMGVSRVFGQDRLGLCSGRAQRSKYAASSRLNVVMVESQQERAMAWSLAARRYAWRRYEFQDVLTPFPDVQRAPHYTTLLALQGDDPVGTVTVGLDSAAGLLVDEVNGREVNGLRAGGARVAEFVRLAIEDAVDSKQVWIAILESLAALCLGVYRVTDMLIEVNPRHVPFYKRVFGFEPIGPERTCLRVGAPSILLRLTRAQLQHKLGLFQRPPVSVRPMLEEEAVAA